ncbi:MAG TPA: crosslink repair DNA glycosylase YcaQ family protein [Anaeromyxobacteraceae bacterium]|nr:crosslink repair DNA glycosylase YcaQ family protein [Anaeromyxobacteraceae bacterium]
MARKKPPGSEGLSRAEARRLALAAQGFGRPRPRRPGAAEVAATIRRLGLLQLDFVNVLVPAHYLVLFSRLGPYDRSLLDEVVYRRREFTEQWAHEASIVPMEAFPLLHHRRASHRVRPWGFEAFLARNAPYAARLLEEVRARGPLTADELREPRAMPRELRHAWFKSAARAVLEAHFGRGLLAVHERRPNFQRSFDLVERVVPAEHRGPPPERAEAQRALLAAAARAHGVGTAADLADYHRMPVAEARPRLAELVESGALREVQVEGWRETAFLHDQAADSRPVQAAALLAPFDPVVWYRRRAARLFGFDYRFEIFVPPRKRRWGKYVLPFLLGDALVARVDVEADRPRARLSVGGAWAEPGASPERVAAPLAVELSALARWLGLGEVAVGRRGPLSRPLASALHAL